MSSASLPQADLATVPPPPPETMRPGGTLPRRSFLGRLALDVAGRWGARIAMVWIALLVLFAVFAPVLASSHPIAWRLAAPAAGFEAGVSSPLLRYLTPTDVILAVALLAAVVLLSMRALRFGLRVQLWAGVVVMTAAVAWFVVRPPETIVYAQYREAAEAGHVEWSLHAPIPYSPNDRQRDVLARQGLDPRLLPPGGDYLLGTTDNGADVASRMIHATRTALAIGLMATAIEVVIGVVVGGLLGYFAGWVDLIGMRLVEVFSAIPVIFLLIMIVAFYGRSLYLMMLIIGLTGWVGYAIYVRAEFLKIRNMDYVQAARALGVPLRSILFRHMLPNGITPVLVLASFGIASAILTESTLSFLGLGLVEEPSWGQMLNQARSAGNQWGLVVFPGLAIFLTVFSYNLVGEALRDALDPRTQERRD